MKLYNSKTNTIETLHTIVPNEVSMYVCGPTVYNPPHIGNARPIVVFDVLRRVLEAQGYSVKMVSNYTDVDDRIIAKALDEGVAETVISQRYINIYDAVRNDLNAKSVDASPKATEAIPAIITFIQELIAKDFAYVVHGDVYFRVNRIEDYGIISSQNINELLVGARIEANTDKENPLDFALWKQTNDQGIKWDSPWGMGRPGWHTECVVMIHDELSNLIDIHGGGQDLRFPHHDNESAQCKAIHKHDIANFWVHNAMLNLDGVKMSKSLGNVQWAQDFIDRLGSNVTRWLLLSTHYRLVLNITETLVSQSQKEIQRIESALKQSAVLIQRQSMKMHKNTDGEIFAKFLEAMTDDMNVANAQVVLFDTLKKLNQIQRQKQDDGTQLVTLLNTVQAMLHVLGIFIDTPILSDATRQLFEDWEHAKQAKDFARADAIRVSLEAKGVL